MSNNLLHCKQYGFRKNSTTELAVNQIVEDLIEDSGSRVNGFVGDILNCALCEIDYHELASHYEEEE